MASKGLGQIIVGSLDTLMIMNLTSRLSHARDWIVTTLDYDQNQDVNTFETTTRMLGGLLSAHYLSTTFPDMAPLVDDEAGAASDDLKDIYLEKAVDLADRLGGAFESISGISYARFNLKTRKGVPSHDNGGASFTAEAAGVQLEMKYISKLTGEKSYWDQAEKAMQVIDDNGADDGLVSLAISPSNGRFSGKHIRLGSGGDSYYGVTSHASPPHTSIDRTKLTNTDASQNTLSSSISRLRSRSPFTSKCGTRLWLVSASTLSPTLPMQT